VWLCTTMYKWLLELTAASLYLLCPTFPTFWMQDLGIYHWYNEQLHTVVQCKCSLYEGVSKSIRTESIMKWTTINTRWDAPWRVMAAKTHRLTHKIAIQLHLVAESCTICSSRSRRSVRKLLHAPSYSCKSEPWRYSLWPRSCTCSHASSSLLLLG
jgi:hypothetical protein